MAPLEVADPLLQLQAERKKWKWGRPPREGSPRAGGGCSNAEQRFAALTQHIITRPPFLIILRSVQMAPLEVATLFYNSTAEGKKRGRPSGEGGPGGGRGRGKPGPRGTAEQRGAALTQRIITVPLLIKLGLLEAGKAVKVSHRGLTVEGRLEADGSVVTEEETFEDCGAFATAVKRRVAPECRADDGWRSVTCEGRSLHDFRSDALEG
jgi:hypothetical protein